MLKQVIAIVAFVGILFQTFSSLTVYTAFYLNQNYIAKNLCENRDKPMKKCCGKCYLKKKLAQQQKQDQVPNSQNQRDKQDVVLFFDNYKPAIAFTIPENVAQQYSSYDDLFTSSFHHAVFRPPVA